MVFATGIVIRLLSTYHNFVADHPVPHGTRNGAPSGATGRETVTSEVGRDALAQIQ